MSLIKPVIDSFFEAIKENEIEIYNEFAFQHELGILLREKLEGYKVQFERNVSDPPFFIDKKKTIKKEMDIAIFNSSEKYAIELKYPRNGHYPGEMYSFVEDIQFAEQLKKFGFQNTYCLVLVDDRLFYSGNKTDGIYKYFRKECKVYGTIPKPTGAGKNEDFIELDGKYPFTWEDAGRERRFYVIEI